MNKILKKLSIVAMLVLLVAGAFLFAGCEKENSATTKDHNIVKSLGEEEYYENIYYSTPENPNLQIRLSDGRTETLQSILLENEIGEAIWTGEHTFICRGHGNTCGRCFETNAEGDIIREGTYAHIRDNEGRVVVTYYNWDDRYQAEY